MCGLLQNSSSFLDILISTPAKITNYNLIGWEFSCLRRCAFWLETVCALILARNIASPGQWSVGGGAWRWYLSWTKHVGICKNGQLWAALWIWKWINKNQINTGGHIRTCKRIRWDPSEEGEVIWRYTMLYYVIWCYMKSCKCQHSGV